MNKKHSPNTLTMEYYDTEKLELFSFLASFYCSVNSSNKCDPFHRMRDARVNLQRRSIFSCGKDFEGQTKEKSNEKVMNEIRM